MEKVAESNICWTKYVNYEVESQNWKTLSQSTGISRNWWKLFSPLRRLLILSVTFLAFRSLLNFFLWDQRKCTQICIWFQSLFPCFLSFSMFASFPPPSFKQKTLKNTEILTLKSEANQKLTLHFRWIKSPRKLMLQICWGVAFFLSEYFQVHIFQHLNSIYKLREIISKTDANFWRHPYSISKI